MSFRRRQFAPNTPAWVFGAAGIVSALLLLEFLPRLGVLDARFVPPFSEMITAIAADVTSASLWVALGETASAWGFGLLISAVAGIVLGIAIGSSQFLREYTSSTIEFLRPVPSVALIPVAVMLLGTGVASTVFLVFGAAFWPVLIQVLAGVQDVDPVAEDTARSYRYRRLTRIRTVVWPTALPYVMTGLRLAASVALILTITGELLISGDGIGGLISVARESEAVASMYAYVIVAGALGVLVNLLARWVEKRTLFWHSSIRMEEAA